MVIAYASMRTDIPAFYSQWLLNRIREGYLMVRSPYRKNLLYYLPFSPDNIDVLGFCTKNPAPLLGKMDYLKGWNTLFHVTITPYSSKYEEGIRNKRDIVESFRNLSLRIGKERVVWRYDPVFLAPDVPLSFHKAAFSSLCSLLEGYTERVIFSFLDVYPFMAEKMASMEIRPPEKNEMAQLASFFSQEGNRHGMTVSSCGEGDWLSAYGIDTSGCLTREIWNKAAGEELMFPKKEGKRKECSCFLGFDIGGYGECPNACVYCYGGGDRRKSVHSPSSPLLFGWPGKDDEIKKVEDGSWKSKEGWLF